MIAVVCDVCVTGSMFYYLWRAKQLSSRRWTVSLLTRLITLTIETGAIYTAATILTVILFIISPHTTMYIVPFTLTSKLHTNCLVAVCSPVHQQYTMHHDLDTRTIHLTRYSTLVFVSLAGEMTLKALPIWSPRSTPLSSCQPESLKT